MEEAANVTIHPACLQEPPLAMDVIRRKWFLIKQQHGGSSASSGLQGRASSV